MIKKINGKLIEMEGFKFTVNAEAFRQLYDYHFSENRKTWDWYITWLTQEQFTQSVDYSLGSVCNHVVHLVSVDNTWFCGLRGEEIPDTLNPVHFHQLEKIRTHWDKVEQKMREYLSNLQDHMLTTNPLDEDDKDLMVWQVLLHVVNHGTDHRSQLLRIIHDLGMKTGPQDFIFHVYENV